MLVFSDVFNDTGLVILLSERLVLTTLGYNARTLYTTFLYLHHLSSDNELKTLRYEVFSGVTSNQYVTYEYVSEPMA